MFPAFMVALLDDIVMIEWRFQEKNWPGLVDDAGAAGRRGVEVRAAERP